MHGTIRSTDTGVTVAADLSDARSILTALGQLNVPLGRAKFANTILKFTRAQVERGVMSDDFYLGSAWDIRILWTK